MTLWFKIITKSLLKFWPCFFLPLGVGMYLFLFTHNWVENHLIIKSPTLINSPFTPFFTGLGNWLVFAAPGGVTQTQVVYLYLISIFSLFITAGASYWNLALPLTPTFLGPVAILISITYLLWIIISYYNLPADITTLWNWFGVTIERKVDFEYVRVLMETYIQECRRVEPGYNPCKMARDSINDYAAGKGLMQDIMIHHMESVELYASYAGKAHLYADKIGPTTFDWYFDYGCWGLWENPANLPSEPEPKYVGPKYFGITEDMYPKDPYPSWLSWVALGAGFVIGFTVTGWIATSIIHTVN